MQQGTHVSPSPLPPPLPPPPLLPPPPPPCRPAVPNTALLMPGLGLLTFIVSRGMHAEREGRM